MKQYGFDAMKQGISGCVDGMMKLNQKVVGEVRKR